MPCPFCEHCKAQEQVDAALAGRMSQSAFDESFMAAVAPVAPVQQLPVPLLNADQQPVALDISNNWKNQKLHYIEGISGTGKTYLLGAMYALFKNNNIEVEVISNSAFPFPSAAKTFQKIFATDDEKLEALQIILIDNGNTISQQLMKTLSQKLKKALGNDIEFGGISIVLVADFGQLLPIVNNNNNQKIKESLKYLTTNTVVPFKKHVLKGGQNEFFELMRMVRTSPKVIIPEGLTVPGIEELIQFIYGPLQNEPPHTDGIILTAKRTDVEVINRRVLDQMRGKVKKIVAKFNAKVIRSDLELHELRLKKNCIIVLEEPAEGLPKGTRLVFEEETPNHLCCRVIETNRQVDIERKNRRLSGPGDSPMKHSNSTAQMVKQFPVSLGFGATIHSVQGKRFEKVGVFKADQVFEHGMMYTAISRAGSIEGLRVHSDRKEIPNKLEPTLIA